MSVPAATYVANSFVKQYYGILAQKPDQLYKFYKAQSVFSFSRGDHGGGPGSTVSAVGQEDIHGKIMATLRPFNGHSCKAEIIGIDSQESRQGGVLVLVTGYLIVTGTHITQHFTQSFFLDKQTQPYEGYFVLNDILRHLPPTVHNAAMPRQPPAQGPMMMPEAFFQPQGQQQMHPALQPQAQQWAQMQPPTQPQQPMHSILPPHSGQAVFAPPMPTEAGSSPEQATVVVPVPSASGAAVQRAAAEPAGATPREGAPKGATTSEEAAQQPQEMPGEAVGEERYDEDTADEEVDERVAEISLDIEEEEEEEEEERPVDEEVDAEEAEVKEAAMRGAEAQRGQDVDDAALEAARGESHSRPAMAAGNEQDLWERPSSRDEAVGGGISSEPLDSFEPLTSGVAEVPRTWASMAGRLQQEGGGQLRASKVQGFACPAAPKAGKGGSSGSRSAAVAHPSGHVWLWVSRLPVDPPAEAQEVLDGLNGCLVEWGCDGRAIEIERRDMQQEWGSILVTSQEAAETLITLSKDRGVMLRSKPLKVELHRLTYTGPRRQGRGSGEGRGSGTSKGGGAGGSGRDEDRHESGKAGGDGKGGARPRRKLRGPVEGRDRYSTNSPCHSMMGESGSRGFGRTHK